MTASCPVCPFTPVCVVRVVDGWVGACVQGGWVIPAGSCRFSNHPLVAAGATQLFA